MDGNIYVPLYCSSPRRHVVKFSVFYVLQQSTADFGLSVEIELDGAAHLLPWLRGNPGYKHGFGPREIRSGLSRKCMRWAVELAYVGLQRTPGRHWEEIYGMWAQDDRMPAMRFVVLKV